MSIIADPFLGPPLAYRVRDAAYLLSTHEGRIYQMIRDGELPVVKIGGVMRIRREDLERLLEKPTRETAKIAKRFRLAERK